MLLGLACRPPVGGASSLWPAGYAWRMSAAAPIASLGLAVSIAPLVLFVPRQHDHLRSAGNGGEVQSAEGWDIRYGSPTLGRLVHDLDLYDPATGLVGSYVRFGAVEPDRVLRLDLYYGKAGLAGSEADSAACWAGCLHSIRLRDGIDRSGNGADLALENVTSAALAGGAAGDFAASV